MRITIPSLINLKENQAVTNHPSYFLNELEYRIATQSSFPLLRQEGGLGGHLILLLALQMKRKLVRLPDPPSHPLHEKDIQAVAQSSFLFFRRKGKSNGHLIFLPTFSTKCRIGHSPSHSLDEMENRATTQFSFPFLRR